MSPQRPGASLGDLRDLLSLCTSSLCGTSKARREGPLTAGPAGSTQQQAAGDLRAGPRAPAAVASESGDDPKWTSSLGRVDEQELLESHRVPSVPPRVSSWAGVLSPDLDHKPPCDTPAPTF